MTMMTSRTKVRNKAWFGICESFNSLLKSWSLLDAATEHANDLLAKPAGPAGENHDQDEAWAVCAGIVTSNTTCSWSGSKAKVDDSCRRFDH